MREDRGQKATGGVLVAWALTTLYLCHANPVIRNSDMFGFIPRAEAFRLADPSSFVSGFYPFGYPLLLRATYLVCGDYAVAGQILSWLFGVGGLFLVYRTASLWLSPHSGLLAVIACGTNPTYIKLSTTGGTDIPAATLMLLSTYLLCRSRLVSPRYVGGAGFALGLAYLTRYTAITLLPATLLWCLVSPTAGESSRGRVRAVTLFSVGFVLAAFPQLAVSMAEKGNPLFNTQVQNIHFGMYGAQNWGLRMSSSLKITSLSELILEDPLAFFRHWYVTLQRLFRIEFIQFPLGFVAIAGLLASLRYYRTRAFGLLLALQLAAFALAVSMAFVDTRLVIFVTMLAAISAAVGLLLLSPRHFRLARGLAVPLRAGLAVLLSLWLAWEYVAPIVRRPMADDDRAKIAAFAALAQDGVRPASRVLSFYFDYYDLGSPTKDRYAIPWYVPGFEPYRSVRDMVDRMKAAGQTHLVFDSRAPSTVPGLSTFWSEGAADLQQYFTEVRTGVESVSVYRLRTSNGSP